MTDKKRPKIGLGVMVFNGQKVLLAKRKNSHGEGMWCCPGGHLEWGERFEECAKREVLEETGVEVDDVEIVGITNDITEEWDTHYITICTKGGKWKGEPQVVEPEKNIKVGWYPLDDLPLPLFPATRKMIFNFREGRIYDPEEQED